MSNFISLAAAREMVQRFRQNKSAMLTQQFSSSMPDAETFDRAQFDVLLSKQDCTGIRIYNGMSEDLKLHTIIVGVNANGDDMITVPTGEFLETDDGEDEIIEDGKPCPPYCPPDSPLNP